MYLSCQPSRCDRVRINGRLQQAVAPLIPEVPPFVAVRVCAPMRLEMFPLDPFRRKTASRRKSPYGANSIPLKFSTYFMCHHSPSTFHITASVDDWRETEPKNHVHCDLSPFFWVDISSRFASPGCSPRLDRKCPPADGIACPWSGGQRVHRFPVVPGRFCEATDPLRSPCPTLPGNQIRLVQHVPVPMLYNAMRRPVSRPGTVVVKLAAYGTKCRQEAFCRAVDGQQPMGYGQKDHVREGMGGAIYR